MPEDNMLGKWDGWYKKAKEMGAFRYGNTVTYTLAAEFLSDMETVEDWGCGTAGFKRFYKGNYIGVDGSKTPFTQKVVDLRAYRSSVDGIVMRHVLEHNYDWKKVLENAVASFQKKFCLILFTPFHEVTEEIAHNKKYGVDVPDLAFKKEDIEKFFKGFMWRMESFQTKTGYGVEHVYFIEKQVEKTLPKIAVISANLGGLDKMMDHTRQSMHYDNFVFTDENFWPRFNAMTPRLQAKIPKCFGWQMVPDYEYYLWLDSTLALSQVNSLRYFFDNCQGYDIVVFRHPTHPNLRQEARYTSKGVNQKRRYMVARYENELVKEQYAAIHADKDFVDDLLVNGGAFMYRNTPGVQQMLKEWWYNISRYIIQDQISFAYVLKKSGLKINVKEDDITRCAFLKSSGHKAGSK